MGKVVNLHEERRLILAKRGFHPWSEMFSEPFNSETTLTDLSDNTLAFLIEGDEEANKALQALVMAFKGLGTSAKFHFLANRDKMLVMDINLYLLDQLRFQAMKRLDWIEDSPIFHIPILDLVESFHNRQASLPQQPPPLSPLHPGFNDYLITFSADRGSFIRRMIPEVISAFKEKAGWPPA